MLLSLHAALKIFIGETLSSEVRELLLGFAWHGSCLQTFLSQVKHIAIVPPDIVERFKFDITVCKSPKDGSVTITYHVGSIEGLPCR